MSQSLPLIYLARHGETEWSVSGKHTGRTDLPLIEEGEKNALRLGGSLTGIEFARVFTSPLIRAKRTCEIAGFGNRAEVDPDLMEWDYGEVEGLTTAEYHNKRPGWDLFSVGAPGGESIAAISDRADRVVSRVRAISGNVLLFSSAHILRVLAARWVGAEAAWGRSFYLNTASISILGYEHNYNEPTIRLWNNSSRVSS